MTGDFQWLSSLKTTWDAESSDLALCLLSNSDPIFWQTQKATLSPAEQEKCERLGPAGAKNSFCLGNAAAKKAIGQLAGKPESGGAEIAYGVFGYPIVRGAGAGLSVSIAHSESAAAALAFRENIMAGIDLEQVRETNCDTIRSILTTAERQMGEALPLDETLFLHHAWTAREALSKALRTGFLLPAKLLELQSIKPNQGFFDIAFAQCTLFRGISFAWQNHVVSIVLPSKCSLDFGLNRELLGKQ